MSRQEEVREFYDRYPYPRPVDSLDAYRHVWEDRQRRRADHLLFFPSRPYREDPSILIAGCGTSQAAKHALRWPMARVTAIDLSETSVRHTEELKRKYDLRNLEVRQLSVERAGELEASFDQIVCTGVLHHLADPDAGLRALAASLAPDGAMHLMVYAPYGRTGIYMMQEFCRRVGLQATGAGIRDLVATLEALPPGHPLESLQREAPDFGHEAGIADALLHPQDRAYSVPQLFEFIHRAGLTFGRWMKQAPYSFRCGVVAHIPPTQHFESLPPAEQYAAVELFRGTMVRHSAVVYRSDRARSSPPGVTWDGDAWLGYVPMRLPDTVCVEERVPPGAVAVLINRTHTYRDLFMPIDSREKLLFDAIDGERRLGSIVDGAGASSEERSSHEAARWFFERLWWHDQIAVDASAPPQGEAAGAAEGA